MTDTDTEVQELIKEDARSRMEKCASTLWCRDLVMTPALQALYDRIKDNKETP